MLQTQVMDACKSAIKECFHPKNLGIILDSSLSSDPTQWITNSSLLCPFIFIPSDSILVQGTSQSCQGDCIDSWLVYVP